MKKSNELLENLKNKWNFKIYFDNDDLGIDYWKYFEDGYYHGIVEDHVVGRLSLKEMNRAIVDENYWIKLGEIENGN